MYILHWGERMRWLIKKLDREGKIHVGILMALKKRLIYIYDEYANGFGDIQELIDLIESHKDLKTLFAYWIADKVQDNLINFSIHDFTGLNGKFAPYKEDLHTTVEEFYKELIRAI